MAHGDSSDFPGGCLWEAGRMKLSKGHFYFVGVISIGFFLLFIALNFKLSEAVSRALSSAFVAYAIGWFLWDRWVWKMPFAAKLTGIPDLNGIWKGRLYSSFNGGLEKDTQISIKQTASKFIVENKTNEIESISFISIWDGELSHKKKDLFYIYRTYPKSEFKDKNPIQYGTGKIIHDKAAPDTIRLDYWTDRGTKGYMDLKRGNEN